MENKKKAKIIKDLIKTVNNEKLTDSEIIDVYTDLGISIGCAMSGLDAVPLREDLEKKYYLNPTVGESLLLQSLLLRAWIDNDN